MLDEKLPVSSTESPLTTRTLKSNRDYLRLYSEMEFRVFPTKDKKPSIIGWQKKASPDIEVLLSDQSLFGGKFHDNEIGTSTGITFFVVDDDVGDLEGMPMTPYFNTRRGFQYLLKVPEGFEVKNFRNIIEGVDIRGVGGLSILPSEFNDREWVIRPDEVPIADCPEWLLERIRDYQDSKNSPNTKSYRSETYSYFSGPIHDGERNDTLFDRALFLLNRSFSPEEVLSDLISLNDNYCSPPLPHDEVQSIVDSAFSYVDGENSEKIRAMREKVTSSMWRGTREKNIRSILIAMLTEDIERYTFHGDDIEVSIAYRRISEKTGISVRSVMTIVNAMMPHYLKKGRPSRGRRPGTLIIRGESVTSPINSSPLSNPIQNSSIEEGLSIGEDVNSPLFLLEMNSQRMGNLGKAACMILEILMERPHTRREIVDRLGYSRNGACGVLKKLRDEKNLVVSDNGLYSLAENFFDLLQDEIETNNEDIETLGDHHQSQRQDYHLRLEAWDRAVKDFHREILPTAKETGGAYLFCVVQNRFSVIKNLAYMDYIELKAAQRAENDICYTDSEPTEDPTEGDEPGPTAAATPVRPQALRDQYPYTPPTAQADLPSREADVL